MLSPTTSKLIMTTPPLLTKAIIVLERFWNPGTVRKHLMRTIILALSRNNEVFFLTKIFNEILNNFYSILFNCIFNTLHFRIFIFKSFRPLKTSVQAIESLYFFGNFKPGTVFNIWYDDPVAPLSFRKMYNSPFLEIEFVIKSCQVLLVMDEFFSNKIEG